MYGRPHAARESLRDLYHVVTQAARAISGSRTSSRRLCRGNARCSRTAGRWRRAQSSRRMARPPTRAGSVLLDDNAQGITHDKAGTIDHRRGDVRSAVSERAIDHRNHPTQELHRAHRRLDREPRTEVGEDVATMKGVRALRAREAGDGGDQQQGRQRARWRRGGYEPSRRQLIGPLFRITVAEPISAIVRVPESAITVRSSARIRRSTRSTPA